MKKILVIGGNGFLGKNLKKVFLDTEYEMFYESRVTNLDLTDYDSTLHKINQIKPDIIINAAANVGSVHYVNTYAADVIDVNSRMILNLYSTVSKSNPNIIIINPIANCTYPSRVHLQKEDEWWDGPLHQSVESYATTRKLGFTISECYKRQYGVKTINLIMPNAYGVFDHTDPEKTHAMNGIIIRMIESQKNGDSEFVVWGSGKPIREWIYMEDMARIIEMVVTKEMYDLPNPINIGQNEGVSIMESVNICKTMLEYDVRLVNDLTKQDGTPIKVMGDNIFKEYFKDFKFTPYDEGITNTINYYKENIKPYELWEVSELGGEMLPLFLIKRGEMSELTELFNKHKSSIITNRKGGIIKSYLDQHGKKSSINYRY